MLPVIENKLRLGVALASYYFELVVFVTALLGYYLVDKRVTTRSKCMMLNVGYVHCGY